VGRPASLLSIDYACRLAGTTAAGLRSFYPDLYGRTVMAAVPKQNYASVHLSHKPVGTENINYFQHKVRFLNASMTRAYLLALSFWSSRTVK
jgi:hypothetical protein